MNVGLLILALFLAGASIFGIIMIGTSSQGAYTDSFGNVSSPASNATMERITNTTAPLLGAGGGLVLVIAASLVFVVAFFVVKSISYNNSSRR